MPTGPINFAMRARMLRAVFSLSLRRMVLAPSLLAHLGIAAVPLFIVTMIHFATWKHHGDLPIQRIHSVMEMFLRILYLHFVVFFIANILGSAVIRQERDEQTLHYFFLQPVRRWMVICGKFAAYLLVSGAICVASFWIAYLALALPVVGLRGVGADLFSHGRFAVMGRETLVLLLGLVAYGAFALIMGGVGFFKSASYSLFLLGWEAGLPYLPSTLKFWTFAHYLQSLLPEHIIENKDMFELLGEPASTGMSLAVLLGVAALFIGVATLMFRYRECQYGGEP